MMEFNFDLPAFLLSLFCLLYCLIAKHRQYLPPKTLRAKLKSQHFVFLIMLISNVFCAGTSVVTYYLPNVSFPTIEFWQYFMYVIYFFFHSTLSLAFALYIMNVTGTGSNWKKVFFIIFLVPYIVSEILVLTNFLNHWTFSVDEQLIYHRGPLMYLLYGLGVFYVLVAFIAFIKNKKAISHADSTAVALFIIIGTLGIVTQAVFSFLLIELFFESLACLVLMVVLEEKSGYMDFTTGLLNRLSFIDTNRLLIGSKQKYAIVLIQLKEFEKIVKRFGEMEADSFLRHVSAYLLRESEVNDVFSCRRDEFAILFKNVEKYEKAEDFANSVLSRFEDEWLLDAIRIKSEVMVTVIRVPENIQTFEQLDNLISADYHKTKPGSYFVPIEDVIQITKTSLYEEALKDAINKHKLRLYFQPIWSIAEKRTVSAEALLRVDDDALSKVSPEEYIPIAEKTGLIKDIGLFVFEETCLFLSSPVIKKSSIQFVEVNLSVFQFMHRDLIDSFENIRKRYNVPAEKINLEITESMAALDDSTISKQLDKFVSLGYSLSLDDFGTGYSNVIRMMTSGYQNIKIDKSILLNISRKDKNISLLMGITDFIRKQGFHSIQEGVETKEELDLVIKCGCDYVQGFYFSKAVPFDEFVAYLEKENEAKS